MKPDKFKRAFRTGRADDRLRRQIATEAARRLLVGIAPEADLESRLEATTAAEYYAAKRRAAAVLGHFVRPGDLPSDAEVREQARALDRAAGARTEAPEPDEDEPTPPEPDAETTMLSPSEHLDRFALFRLKLEPLEAVKQDPRYHPEGDTLYHSLQVFELARATRPYDEEFLLAALLHDIGKAIDPRDHALAGVQALKGLITERTSWLIEHHMHLLDRPGRAIGPRQKRVLEESIHFEDLTLLRELDHAGRAVGVAVCTLDEALDYLRGLESEVYLEAAEHEGPTT
jgi:predicted HD phosphohydrolase